MSQQGSFHEGWRSESLAYYILSKFAFIDKPSTIGDDIGIDFFGTIFKEDKQKFNTNLKPTKFQFAIQIKSNKQQFELKPDHITNLQNIHHPLLIGVIDNKKQVLHVFTNDAFDYHLSHKGFNKLLMLRYNSKKIKLKQRCIREHDRIILLQNYLLSFKVNDTPNQIMKKVDLLKSKLEIMQYNISNRFNGKYIFIDPYDAKNPSQSIVTGCDSFNQVQIELNNYFLVFKKNLEWLKQQIPIENQILQQDINNGIEYIDSVADKYDQLIKFGLKRKSNKDLIIMKTKKIEKIVKFMKTKEKEM